MFFANMFRASESRLGTTFGKAENPEKQSRVGSGHGFLARRSARSKWLIYLERQCIHATTPCTQEGGQHNPVSALQQEAFKTGAQCDGAASVVPITQKAKGRS